MEWNSQKQFTVVLLLVILNCSKRRVGPLNFGGKTPELGFEPPTFGKPRTTCCVNFILEWNWILKNSSLWYCCWWSSTAHKEEVAIFENVRNPNRNPNRSLWYCCWWSSTAHKEEVAIVEMLEILTEIQAEIQTKIQTEIQTVHCGTAAGDPQLLTKKRWPLSKF